MCLPGTMESVRASCERGEQSGISRRAALAGGGAAALAAMLPGVAGAHGKRDRHDHHGGGHVTDLTHVFRAGFPVYVGASARRRDLNTFAVDGYYAQEWTFGEHSATHMDAPGPFRARRTPGPGAAARGAARADRRDRHRRARGGGPGHAGHRRRPRRYERRHGRIPHGAAVLMNSGWDAQAGDEAAFKNADASGMYHFPGFSVEAVELLLDRTRAAVIGVDTLSLDPGNSSMFQVHVDWLGDRPLRSRGHREPRRRSPRAARR